jgi:hypothetical protein
MNVAISFSFFYKVLIRPTAGGSAPPRLRRAGPGALGRIQYVGIIVTTNPKPQLIVRLLILGQSLPSRSKTARLCSLSSFGCEARVACSRGLGGSSHKRIYYFR